MFLQARVHFEPYTLRPYNTYTCIIIILCLVETCSIYFYWPKRAVIIYRELEIYGRGHYFQTPSHGRHAQGIWAGTRLSQHHDTQLHKKICSCTDFTICTVLNWLIAMQLHTQVLENHATVYPGNRTPCNCMCNCVSPLSSRKKL